MIKHLHTVIALPTMSCLQWPSNETSRALPRIVQRQETSMLFRIAFQESPPRNDARVDTGSQVQKHKHCHHRNEEQNRQNRYRTKIFLRHKHAKWHQDQYRTTVNAGQTRPLVSRTSNTTPTVVPIVRRPNLVQSRHWLFLYLL